LRVCNSRSDHAAHFTISPGVRGGGVAVVNPPGPGVAVVGTRVFLCVAVMEFA
jgi:hypothetical protein